MKLITEVTEQVNYLTEKVNGEKKFVIEGVFMQANMQNRNGRVYPLEILQKEVARYNEQFVSKGRALGELGHPEGPQINLERVSHKITSLVQEGDNFVGRAEVMDTPYGNIVKSFIKSGVQLGVSSRGMGSIVTRNGMNEVQEDFMLATPADIVADPSAPEAFVNGIMENTEWVWENGIIKAQDIEVYKKTIEKTKMSELEEVTLNIFNDFISKL